MGSGSDSEREGSPDWLRTFQTPSKIYTTISSSPSTSSHGTNSKDRSRFSGKLDAYPNDDLKEEINSLHSPESDQSKRAKEFSPKAKLIKKADLASPKKKQSKKVQHQSTDEREEETDLQEGKDEDLLKDEGVTLPEEDAAEGQERRTKRALSTLPLVFGDKVHRSKVLLECEGDALDVSGDVGAVGRLSVSANQDNDFLLDLKGVIYKATILPSNTFFVVNIGQTEAKVEAIMNDFVQIQPSANVFDTETMIEGTLEGFGFDSDEDFHPVAAGTSNAGKLGDELKDGKKKAKQKARSNEALKSLKGPIKKAGKTKSAKAGKGGGMRKNAKKTSTTKRSGK